MFRANALYEGSYLLGTSIARPLIAKRQIEIAAPDRRRRGRARRHRQGQRPGPLRADLLRAQPAHQGHRALARMGPGQPREADRVRREPADPDPARQARRGALLHRRQPAAHLLRGQGARGPLGRARRGDVHPHRRAGGGARQADLCRDRLRARRRGRGRRRARCRRRSLLRRLNELGRRQRHRPARPGREPLRRHEVAAASTRPRAARSCWRRTGRSRASPSTAVRCTSRTS